MRRSFLLAITAFILIGFSLPTKGQGQSRPIPITESERGAKGAPITESERGAKGAPITDSERGAKGAPITESERGAKGAPITDSERGAGKVPITEAEGPPARFAPPEEPPGSGPPLFPGGSQPPAPGGGAPTSASALSKNLLLIWAYQMRGYQIPNRLRKEAAKPEAKRLVRLKDLRREYKKHLSDDTFQAGWKGIFPGVSRRVDIVKQLGLPDLTETRDFVVKWLYRNRKGAKTIVCEYFFGQEELFEQVIGEPEADSDEEEDDSDQALDRNPQIAISIRVIPSAVTLASDIIKKYGEPEKKRVFRQRGLAVEVSSRNPHRIQERSKDRGPDHLPRQRHSPHRLARIPQREGNNPTSPHAAPRNSRRRSGTTTCIKSGITGERGQGASRSAYHPGPRERTLECFGGPCQTGEGGGGGDSFSSRVLLWERE